MLIREKFLRQIVLILIALFITQYVGARDDEANIIIVFIDDMGWADLSCFGNNDARTPNIDRMAAEGIAFEQFYVNSPICSPSRVAISTGQYPQRWGITSYLNNYEINEQRGMANWLDPKAPMLARSLKEAGYATGHFGKWHMGGQRDVAEAPPITDYGFDESLTNFEGMGPKLLPLTMKPGWEESGRIWADAEILGGPVTWMQRSTITGGFVEAAMVFIKKAEAEKKPFYINVWPDDVHSPFFPPVEKWGNSKRELYLAVLEEMDRQLAPLFDYVRENKDLRDNTLILICSDNGHEPGAGEAGILKGCKTNLFEGGIRSSLIAWGPGLVNRETVGTRNKTSVFAAIDFLPSLLKLTEVKPTAHVTYDGEEMLNTLLGKSETSRKAPIFFSRPPDRKDFYGFKNLPDLAVRDGQWKLLCDYGGGRPNLFNIITDPGESKNLAGEYPEITNDLSKKVTTWYQSMPPRKNYYSTYKPQYKSQWSSVEKFTHHNFNTTIIDGEKKTWIKGRGLVLPHSYMGIGVNNPTFFYWDNYFTNKGLLLIDSLSGFAKNATDNLLWEVDTLGFVPNANVNWGMNRSQTPYLAMMVKDIYEHMDVKDSEWLLKAYHTLKMEYHFWTDTSSDAIEDHNTSVKGLQRFYHHASKEELFELYNQIYKRKLVPLSPDSISDEEKMRIAGIYAAEAETMDFTPRFENRCPDFIAIDLNSNLYKYEKIFAWIVGELKLKDEPEWKKLSDQRKDLINQYCWNEEEGLFMDFDFVNKRFSKVRSIASMYPLFVGLATQDQAERARLKLSLFEFDYGVTVCEKTDQEILYQWDYPAGWPPVHLFTATALHNYGFEEDAVRICSKYLDLVTRNFLDPIPKMYSSKRRNTTIQREKGFIYEKYDAVTGQINDSEYPAGEFLSWSASVFIWCLDFVNNGN